MTVSHLIMAILYTSVTRFTHNTGANFVPHLKPQHDRNRSTPLYFRPTPSAHIILSSFLHSYLDEHPQTAHAHGSHTLHDYRETWLPEAAGLAGFPDQEHPRRKGRRVHRRYWVWEDNTFVRTTSCLSPRRSHGGGVEYHPDQSFRSRSSMSFTLPLYCLAETIPGTLRKAEGNPRHCHR